jgi:nucleoside-diphosphate-sugar epimerase
MRFNILVIGGSGFIGTNLVKFLLSAGHKVSIFDKALSKTFGNLTTLGDVRDLKALTIALEGIDIVYNLAAEHRDDVTPISLYYDVNVQGAKNIRQAAEINGVKKIIFTSSVAVYGLNRPNPDEMSPTEPFNHYGKSKLEAEVVFSEWVDKGEERGLIILRPVVVFGPGNRGNVYNLIKQIQSNRFMMVGLGDNCKSMAYVGNLASFLAKATKFGTGKQLFNFATKPDLTVRELVHLIQGELGLSTRIPKLPYLVGLAGGFSFDLLSKVTGKKFPISSIRIRKFCANTTVSTKALKEIGFQSPFTLQEGLKKMIAHLDQNIYFEGGG